MSAALACVACGYSPEPAFGDEALDESDRPAQPYRATAFVSYGHYGSTVWDPMNDREALVINVCDKCLRDKWRRVVVRTSQPARPRISHRPWDPTS